MPMHKGPTINDNEMSPGPTPKSKIIWAHHGDDTLIFPQLRDPRREIRLLRMVPGGFDDDIHCILSSYELENAPPYHAISYTWGEEYPQREISICERVFTVRENCHFALRQARLHSAGQHIWIDSICIDQENNSEKGHQVEIMGDIYAHALKVLACIGDSDPSFEVIQKVLNFSDTMDSSTVENDQHSQILSTHFENLSKRPYFHRLWILQELKGGNGRTTLLCGQFSMDWESLVMLHTRTSIYETFSSRQLWTICKQISPESTPKLGDMLRDLQQFECADVRDRIYGTLRLVDWEKHGRPKPEPDYTISRWDLALKLLADGPALEWLDIQALVQALELDENDIKISRNGLLPESQMVGEAHVRGACIVCSDDAGNLSANLVAVDGSRITYEEAVNVARSIYKDDALVEIRTGSRLTALACPDTRAGDIIMKAWYGDDSEFFTSVVRPLEDHTFQVNGKAILLDGFALSHSKNWECGCWEWPPDGPSLTSCSTSTKFEASVSDILASHTLSRWANIIDTSSERYPNVLKRLFAIDMPKTGTIFGDVQTDPPGNVGAIRPLGRCCKLHGSIYEAQAREPGSLLWFMASISCGSLVDFIQLPRNSIYADFA